MQNQVLHIVKEKELEGSEDLDTRLSFDGFIHFLKRRLPQEKTMRAKFLEYVIQNFEERLHGKHYIGLDEIGLYGDLLEQMYICIFAPLVDENENVWALGLPVKPVVIYGTDLFYDKLRDPWTKRMKACMIDKGQMERKKLNFELIYSLILRQLYGYTFVSGNAVIRSLEDVDTGLAHFYRLNIDARFIEVAPKGELPPFDPEYLDSHPPMAEAVAWLMEHLPLSAFRFEGISAITVTDITTDYVLDSIKDIILNPEAHAAAQHDEVAHYLKILSGSNDLDFGLLPLLKVNGKPVYSNETCHHSVLAKASDNEQEMEETYLCLVQNYFRETRTILYERLPDAEPGERFFLKVLRRAGVQSYGLIPVYHNDRLAGVLEVSAHVPDAVTKVLLNKLEAVIPLIAQMLEHTIDTFEGRIKSIIKENFTSIQPAVEWKFNEVAWHYDRMQQESEVVPTMETIYFKDVYPLYGAVDIRNSTMERNKALRRDLEIQFGLLTEALVSLQQVAGMELVDEIMHQAQKWQSALTGALTTADELNLNSFLREKVGLFLVHFSQSRPDLEHLMDTYLDAIDEGTGAAYENRRNLEHSIQLVNKTINDALEENIPGLQQSYPTYFEKFRTDGVEYDLYIGQSIAPGRPFDLLYLRNLRLWQLNSMAYIAQQTYQLQAEMTEALLTTQLIFVHSSAIDISFRKDERRFDVEGGYNIRYQVVKKRIDKVRVRDTNERLTQPGMIAIIYFNDREAEEYEGYIRYLQEKGLLGRAVEHLDLEELQGVSGLRALRVSVMR